MVCDVTLMYFSYLGNGLVASRLGMLQSHVASHNTSLVSDCFPEGFTINGWDYAGERWKVRSVNDYSLTKMRQA